MEPEKLYDLYTAACKADEAFHNGENQVANHNGSNHRRKQLRRWQKNALQPLDSRRMLAVSITTRDRRGEA